MSDRERLNQIEDIWYGIGDSLQDEDTDWLVDQAKRVQELEKRLDAECESGYQMEGQLQDAKAENARLRKALEFYGDEKKYEYDLTYDMADLRGGEILNDFGHTARRALKGVSE